MFFNSFEFLLIFLPLTLAVFYLAANSARRTVLVWASLLFYALSGGTHLILLAVEILWVFGLTRIRSFPGNRLLLVAAISLPLGALIFYKYSAFLIQDVMGLPPSHLSGSIFDQILLPIGISFFTFELISFSIDRYRGDAPPASLADLTLLVAFFPHLVAGPILRYHMVAPQFDSLPSFHLSSIDLRKALIEISLGFSLKVLIADSIASFLVPLRADVTALEARSALYLIFGFSYQIYFDFFGYSLIAIGLGRLFGISLPDNFNLPYEALNPRDFWRRWHISLSSWLRDYVYLPLGGKLHYARNIIIVFAVCGIWHGAGWNFVLWGLLHAAMVLIYAGMSEFWDRCPSLVQRAVTFTLVSVAWLPFVFDLAGMTAVLSALTQFDKPPLVPVSGWLLLGAAFCAGFTNRERVEQTIGVGPVRERIAGGIAAALLFTAVLLFDRTTNFIYFRF